MAGLAIGREPRGRMIRVRRVPIGLLMTAEAVERRTEPERPGKVRPAGRPLFGYNETGATRKSYVYTDYL